MPSALGPKQSETPQSSFCLRGPSTSYAPHLQEVFPPLSFSLGGHLGMEPPSTLRGPGHSGRCGHWGEFNGPARAQTLVTGAVCCQGNLRTNPHFLPASSPHSTQAEGRPGEVGESAHPQHAVRGVGLGGGAATGVILAASGRKYWLCLIECKVRANKVLCQGPGRGTHPRVGLSGLIFIFAVIFLSLW